MVTIICTVHVIMLYIKLMLRTSQTVQALNIIKLSFSLKTHKHTKLKTEVSAIYFSYSKVNCNVKFTFLCYFALNYFI